MTATEVAELIERFAQSASAPVRTATEVTSVRPVADSGYLVMTEHGEILARTVVIASGACNLPAVPAFAEAVPDDVEQITPFGYRNADQLPDGGVLVVGASATGVQLAAEIRRSGRPLIMAVGEHVRLPRTYRGRDVLWWMDASGVWDQRHDEVEDLTRARRLPSPQLVGTPERADRVGRGAGRSLGLDPRRCRPVLRRPAQRLRARRPEDEPAARRLRRMGRDVRDGCGGCSYRALRPDREIGRA